MQESPEDLEAIAGRCLERMETEGVAALEQACSEHPEHAARLRARRPGTATLGQGMVIRPTAAAEKVGLTHLPAEALDSRRAADGMA